jgi:hypothetical protein
MSQTHDIDQSREPRGASDEVAADEPTDTGVLGGVDEPNESLDVPEDDEEAPPR